VTSRDPGSQGAGPSWQPSPREGRLARLTFWWSLLCAFGFLVAVSAGVAWLAITMLIAYATPETIWQIYLKQTRSYTWVQCLTLRGPVSARQVRSQPDEQWRWGPNVPEPDPDSSIRHQIDEAVAFRHHERQQQRAPASFDHPTRRGHGGVS
jgi:hypothetical protein